MKRFTPSLKMILLFSFVLVAGLPIFVMGFIGGRLVSANIARDIRAKNLLIAKSLSAEVHIFLDKSFSFLEQVEETVIENRYVKENEINAYLGSALKINEDFESVEILDEEGTVRFVAPMDPNVIGINRSAQVFFSRVRREKQPYWSPTFISLQTEKPTLTLAIPVKGGMLVGYLDLASLNAVTDKIKSGRQGYALMVDQEGTVIAHPDRKMISERQNLRHLRFSAQDEQLMEGNFVYREGPKDHLASLSRVPETQWTVIFTVPADEAFEPVARVRAAFGAGAVTVVLLVVTIVFLSLRKALNPLSQLVHDTRRIADGHYVLEERLSSYKEIDDLAGHFHRMAGMIRSREEALREEQQFSEQILNTMVDTLFVFDPNTGKPLRWNRAFREKSGYTDEEIAAKKIPDDWYTEEDLEKAGEAAEKQLNVGYAILELSLIAKDGTLIPTEYSTSLMIDAEGRPKCIISAGRDITGRKRAEAERLKLERRLQQARKAESLGRMAGAIAHHFNNKLMAVMGNLDLALYHVGPNEKLFTYLSEAQRAGIRAAEVSSLMLAYLGQTLPKAETFDLAKACREELEAQRSSIPQGVTLKIDAPPSGPAIKANQAQVRQILSNLTVNAGEAIGAVEGEIRVSLHTVEAAATSSLHIFPADWKPERDTYACLEVSDTGCGINPEQFDLIFDPFFSTRFTGRGLGLAVVLGAVRSHGGAIAVESEPRRGSVFRVFWPIAEQEPTPARKAEADGSGQIGDTGLILFVDDEAQLRTAAEAMLGHLGFTTIQAGHGSEALEIFRARKDEISLVILDLTMPGMNGWQTLEELRTLRPDVPVVLASGYDEAKVMEGRHAELPQAFLHKPYRMMDLKAALGAATGASLTGSSIR